MFIVDAHLDLSYNATRGRDLTRPAAEQPPDEGCIATVSLPELRAGGVGLVCATVFCEPAHDGKSGYTTPEEAHEQAMTQWQWYEGQASAGRIRWVTRSTDVTTDFVATSPQHAVLLLEGADALRTLDDVQTWFDAGLRIVGLSWKRTRFAGGTGAPGPLTNEGVELVRELDRFGIIHDASHLAEQSFWQLLERSEGPVIASHSNCRAIVPTDRQLSDEMIRAIAARGGVTGINFFDRFLLPPDQYTKRRATLADVVAHVRHICDLTGSAQYVGLGTDMDGGLGREQIPEEINTSADLPRVADALNLAGFGDEDVAAVMGANWTRYLRTRLPSSASTPP